MTDEQFTSILLDDEFSEYKSPNRVLDKLSQVNIFIGANNSGKSRFLRKLFSHKDLRFLVSTIDVAEIDKVYDNLKNELSSSLPKDYFGTQKTIINQIPKYVWLQKKIDFSADFIKVKDFHNELNRFATSPEGSTELKTWQIVDKYFKQLEAIIPIKDRFINFDFQNIYVPILRSFRPIQITRHEPPAFEGNTDNYTKRTRADYFFEADSQIESAIYSGLSFYRVLDEFSHGEPDQRKMIIEYQKFLSSRFFEDQPVEIVPKHGKDVIHVSIGNAEEPIYKLGEGIQAVMLLTFPLFLNRDKTIKVFIEEPEMHLHPGFQRLVIETFKRPEFKNFQFFITTHSNHFLDMTLDFSNISVYAFQKKDHSQAKPEFEIQNVENPDLHTLSLIGARNSSVFLTNCTIWVEGITDRMYIKKYLEIVQQNKPAKFLEDIHYSFVEYGGNNITHWSFLEGHDDRITTIFVDRLCGKLFLVTDRDKNVLNADGSLPANAGKKAKRQKILHEKLGDRYYQLPVKEVENLLLPKIIRLVLLEMETVKEDVLPDIDTSKLVYADYSNEYLGDFIENKVTGLQKSYQSESGTMARKVEFALSCIEKMKDEDDISDDAKKLASAIYDFIGTHNSA